MTVAFSSNFEIRAHVSLMFGEETMIACATEDPIEYRIVRINEWFLSDYIVVKRYDDRNVTCSVEEMAHRTDRAETADGSGRYLPMQAVGAVDIRERRTDRCRFDVPEAPGTNDLRSVILVDAAPSARL